MGGAGFPTNVKLSPKNADEIDYIIVNASECEPYLTSDYRRLLDETDKVIEGLRLALAIFPKAKGIIAVEDNKPKAIQKLKEVLGNDPDIKVNSMKTKYPEGAERQLIYANTGRYINSKMLPADAGCIVHNVDTVYSICEAVRQGKPLIQRLVTVTGDAITEPCNYLVRIGTSFAELIEAAGGFLQDPEKIIAGGPMMGKAIYDLNIPVTKSSSAILCMTKDEVSEYEPSNCIRCGRCVEVCPGRVMPNKLATLAEQGDLEEFQKLNGMECCECGCCSYVCPAKRHLTQTIAGTRKAIWRIARNRRCEKVEQENLKLKVSASPHVRSKATTSDIMFDVVIALVPATAFGLYIFGWYAALLVAVCIGSCVGFEALYQKCMGKKVTVGDFSAVVTGLLLALNLPPTFQSGWRLLVLHLHHHCKTAFWWTWTELYEPSTWS